MRKKKCSSKPQTNCVNYKYFVYFWILFLAACQILDEKNSIKIVRKIKIEFGKI